MRHAVVPWVVRYPTASEYLASVYRDERLLQLPQQTASAMFDNLSWVWHSGVPLINMQCKSTFTEWRPGVGHATANKVALQHKRPNLIWRMSQYGIWLASGLPKPLVASQSYGGPSAGQLWAHHGFVADHTWTEVLRLTPTWTVGEGGLFGCWFEMSKGSGIAVNVGRSLRALNRSLLATKLKVNVTSTFEKPVDGRKGRRHLWHQFRERPPVLTEQPGTSVTSSSAPISLDNRRLCYIACGLRCAQPPSTVPVHETPLCFLGKHLPAQLSSAACFFLGTRGTAR